VLGVGCAREVDLFGEGGSKRYRASYVTIRAVGFSGPEYVSTVRIPKNTTFRVVAAKRKFMFLDDGTTYVVDIDLPGLPKGLDVEIPLSTATEPASAS
jgi:hypothetical protein